MRQVFLFLGVLVLGLSWAVAQTGSSSPQSSTPSGSAQESGSASGAGQSHSGAGGHMTVEGCLSGSNGNYTLTDKNGMSYQLTGDTAKLSDHVGHEIKVMGSSASGAGAESSTGASGGASAGSSGGQTLQVSSVKMVSKSCKAGGGGMSH